jgi:8-oxo-dGTP pyrophosphatase MutT (NUDIX family)
MHPFAEFFQNQALDALPGRSAQQRLAPRFPDGSFRSFDAPEGARQNAVLLVLSHKDEEPSMLFTLRSAHLPTHKGQWSFPGGRMESGETIVEAALRETEEEVGITSHALHVLGRLTSLYTPPSHSIIHPVVAWWNGTEPLKSNADEVEETLLVPLSRLDHGHAVEEEWDYQGARIVVPQWKIHPRAPLWGATAIIVSEFMAMYGDWLRGTASTMRDRI